MMTLMDEYRSLTASCGVGLCEAPPFALWLVSVAPYNIPYDLGGPTHRLSVQAELPLCRTHDEMWSLAFDSDRWRYQNPEVVNPGRVGELESS